MPSPDLPFPLTRPATVATVASVAPSYDGVPPAVLDMQRQAETAFMALKAQERVVIGLQGAQPLPFVRTARPPALARALMRLVPPLARVWQMRAVRRSGLLDTGWYLGAYRDVAASGADPVRHYLRFGAPEGRDPGPRFCTTHYLRLYPDVASAGINPLVHYLTTGWQENRSAHPLMPAGRG